MGSRECTSRPISIGLGRVQNNGGEVQQFRAEPQACAFDGLQVDFKPQRPVVPDQPNHPPIAGKVAQIADGKDALVSQPLEDRTEAVPLRTANEQNVTTPNLTDALEPLDDDLTPLNGLAVKSVFEHRAKRVFAQYADDDSRVCGGEGAGGPVSEPREVVEPLGFDLVLEHAHFVCLRWRILCLGSPSAVRPKSDDQDDE